MHVADLILDGNWAPPGLDNLTQCLILHLAARTSLDAVPLQLTVADWMAKIKPWPESMSTTPSGFHLTHSKALVADHDLDLATEEDMDLEGKRQQLIEWQVALLNLALVNRYSYNWWKTFVNVMLLKEPGNYKIHRLWVIHLCKHDYNLLLALKWQLIIQLCSQQRLLHPGQYGAVPGRDAVIPTMLKEFQYKISCASKRPLIHIDHDETACYEPIVMSLGNLASRAHGQHRSVVFVQAATLAEAKYCLKTQLGVSESYFQHCTMFPIDGSGKGAGNSPAIWCVISSVLFHTYDERAHGASYSSPDGSIHVKIFMIGFVDDTSISTNNFALSEPKPISHYIQLAADNAQRWHDVLSLSGGALQESKCSYHFLHYTFTIDGLPVLQGGRFGPTITIQTYSSPNPVPLCQLLAYESHHTLGIHKAPVSTSCTAVTVLQDKNNRHTQILAWSSFTRTDLWAHYHSVYLPRMVYSFPSSTLTQQQCTALKTQFQQVLLPKYGFNCNMPTALVYGPSKFGGLGLRMLDIKSGISKVYCLLACLRSEGAAAKLALITISWGRFLAGISVPILIHPATPLPHLAPMSWLPQVRQFLALANCRIELSQTFVPPL